MKTTQRHLAVGLTAAILIHASSAAAQKVLYADDFNRAPSKNVGKTSVGSYTWVDPFWHNFEVTNHVLRAGHWNTAPNAHAYVDYDLNPTFQYRVRLKVTTTNIGESGSYAGLFLLPRAVYHDTVINNRGWIVNRNYWDPSGSQTQTRFYWYEGADTNVFGSIAATRIDTNQFLAVKWQDIEISVKGDKATLIVTQDDGAKLVDANRHIGNYNTTKAVFLFAGRTSAGQDKTHSSKPWLNVNIDDLEVFVHPIHTLISIR